MVDWNHNGERDSFDFAMDMMVIEEMKRASSSNRRSTVRGRSMADVSWSEIGCLFYVMFFIAFPVIMAIFFIFMGEGDLFLLTVGFAVALNYAIYRLFFVSPKNTAEQAKAKTSQSETKYTASEPGTEPSKQTVEIPHMKRMGDYDVAVEIRDGAFKGCDKLREVVIPHSANTIGKDAFPHGQNIVIYCYGGSYGLDFARQYKYKYRNAEDIYL